jgi:hypothetical protein
LTRPELKGALNLTDWTKVKNIKVVDAVLEYITDGMISALNISTQHQHSTSILIQLDL